MIAPSNFKGHLVKTSLLFASLFIAPVSMAQEAVVIQNGTPVVLGADGVVLSPGLPPGAMVPGAMPPGQSPPPGTALGSPLGAT